MLKHLLIGAALITGAAVTSNNNQLIAAAEETTSVTSEATSEETSEVTSTEILDDRTYLDEEKTKWVKESEDKHTTGYTIHKIGGGETIDNSYFKACPDNSEFFVTTAIRTSDNVEFNMNLHVNKFLITNYYKLSPDYSSANSGVQYEAYLVFKNDTEEIKFDVINKIAESSVGAIASITNSSQNLFKFIKNSYNHAQFGPGFKLVGLDTSEFKNNEFSYDDFTIEVGDYVLSDTNSFEYFGILGPKSLETNVALTEEQIAGFYDAKSYDDEDLKVSVKDWGGYDSTIKPGETYNVTLTCEDANDYIKDILVPIKYVGELVDKVSPVIEAPNKILKSTGITLTSEDITKMIKVSDTVDEEVDLKLAKDTYTGNADKKGEYEMIYTATDDAGNKTTHKIAIEVANIPSCYVVNNEIFRIQSNQVFTEDDFLTVLDFTEDIPAGATSVNIECEEYLFNTSYNELGEYKVTVSARYSDGRELSVERTIEVFESEEESKSSSNWFVSAWNWIYNTIIKNVANFFISVWNGICEMFNWQDATGNYLDDIE